MKMRVLTVPVLALMAATSFAADKDVEDLLKVLRENYSKVKSVHMEVSSVLQQRGEDIPFTSKVWYRVPAFRIDSKAMVGEATPPSFLIVMDGKTSYIKGFDGKVSKEKFDPDNVSPSVNLETLCFWDWKRQLSTTKGNNMAESQLRLLKKETWKDKDYMVLEEKAPKSNVFVRYYIDPKIKYIVRTAVYSLEDPSQMLQDHKVTKFELNAKVDEKLLKFPS